MFTANSTKVNLYILSTYDLHIYLLTCVSTYLLTLRLFLYLLIVEAMLKDF